MEISDAYLQDNSSFLGESSGSTPLPPPPTKNETPIPNPTPSEDLDETYRLLQKRISDNAKFNSKVIIEFTSKNLEHQFPRGQYIKNLKFTEMKTDVLESINHLSILAGTIRTGMMDYYDVVDRVGSENSTELKKFPNMMTFQRHQQLREFLKNNPDEIEETLIEVDAFSVPLYNILRDGMIIPNDESVVIKLKLEPLKNDSFDKLVISYDLYDVDNKLLHDTSILMGELQKNNKEKMEKSSKGKKD